MPGGARRPLSFPWEVLRTVIPDKMTRYGLSRLISFCSAQGIVPDAVDVGVFERFRAALMNESFLKQPKPVYRTTCILWNEAAESIRGWPKLQVQVPCEKQQYSFAWDEFPPTLLADREAYIEHLGNEDPFADVWPTSMSGLGSSRGYGVRPRTGWARLFSLISRRISSGTLGLPPRPRRAARYP
jgi:hypothetical protein